MNAIAYRQRRRNWGLTIPAQEVEAYLACGWQFACDLEELAAFMAASGDAVLMRPPRAEEAA